MSHAYDIILLGAGTTAFAGTRIAAMADKKVMMTEHLHIGDTCVNRGMYSKQNPYPQSRNVLRRPQPIRGYLLTTAMAVMPHKKSNRILLPLKNRGMCAS
jgi:hypothetical protein